MKILARFFARHNADQTANKLEELDRRAQEERQLARLTKSEFIDSLFQGAFYEDVAKNELSQKPSSMGRG